MKRSLVSVMFGILLKVIHVWRQRVIEQRHDQEMSPATGLGSI